MSLVSRICFRVRERCEFTSRSIGPVSIDPHRKSSDTAPIDLLVAPVIALLDEARKLAKPDAVEQYFGAPPASVTGDLAARPALEREKKHMTTQRETLAKIERLRADVLRATGQWDAAWQAFAQIKRWEAEPADKQTRAIEAAMLEQNGHLGLALEVLNARLKDEPADAKLRTQRLKLYEKLGWTEMAAHEKVHLALLAQQRKIAGKL